MAGHSFAPVSVKRGKERIKTQESLLLARFQALDFLLLFAFRFCYTFDSKEQYICES
jgi:hypothetical protein